MSNDYDHWSRRLAGETLPIENENPRPGFYRQRLKNGAPPIPVAYWQIGDVVYCRYGDRDVSIERGQEIWSWCAQYPVSEEAYRAVAERGEPWPDIDPIVDEQKRLSIGGNLPPDEHITLKDQIASAEAGIGAYAEIKSDEHAAQAQTLRGRLLELKAAAEKQHKTEKQPHLDAGRAVDQRWLPLAKVAQAGADTIRAVLSAWETAKLRKQRAEEAAAQEAGKPVPIPSVVAPTKVKGAVGKAAAIRPKLVAVITNYDAALAHFKNADEVRVLVFQLAQAAVNAGHTVPGVAVDEQREVR